MMADQKTVLRLLKTARGQIDTAADAMLRRANREILSAHLKHCVEHAASDTERAEKIDELVKALEKIL